MTKVLVVLDSMRPSCGLVIVDVVFITLLEIKCVSVTVTSDSSLMSILL